MTKMSVKRKMIAGIFTGVMIVSSSIGVLAAGGQSGITYTTTTAYDVSGSVPKIAVTTVVSGAQDGDQLTYLALKEGTSEVTENSIVYVDQKVVNTSDTTSNKFIYSTDLANIQSIVKVGGSRSGAAFSVDTHNYEGALTVNVVESVGGSSTAYVPGNNANQVKSIPLSNLGNNIINSVTLDTGSGPVAVTDYIIKNGAISIVDTMTDNCTITVNYGSEQVITTPTVTIGTVKLETIYGEQYLSVFGRANCKNSTEYGIVVSANNTFPSTTSGIVYGTTSNNYSNGLFFKSLGKGNNNGYAVALQDPNLTTGTYYIKTYVINSDNTINYSTKTMSIVNGTVTVQ